MKVLINAVLIGLVVALLPFKVLADDSATIFRAGGDFTHFKNKTSIYSIGYEEFDQNGFGHKFELGGWTDTQADHRGAPYAAVRLAKRFGDYEGFHITGFAGGAIIGATDSALGGVFEFTEEVIVGYKRVGGGYTHFSNLSFAPPNQGRDYISATIAFPF